MLFLNQNVKAIFSIFQTRIPDSFLKDYVQQFIYFKGYTPDHSIQRVVPDGSLYLIFELDGMPRYIIDNETLEKKTKRTRAWISGMHKNYITISALPDSEMYVIQFKAQGLFPFIQQKVDALSDKVVKPEAYFGEEVYTFRKALLSEDTPEGKFRLGETWLSQLFSPAHLPKTEVLQVLEKIQSDPGLELNTITSLIQETGLSKKHFSSLFKKYIGLSPKQYQRVIRFNEILLSIQQKEQVEWTQIALSCGYYDQAHFIKEFKLFCGINPSEFITNYKNYPSTNFFPLD